jgi:PhnB protein
VIKAIKFVGVPVTDQQRALDFYKRAFGATELFRQKAPDGKVGHAEVRIGDTVIMIADEFPPQGIRLSDSLTMGAPFEDMNKLAIFSPDDVDATLCQPGRRPRS